MPLTVTLATDADHPDGETGGDLLVEAFAARGATARWVRWDDPAALDADVVAVRSTWDYILRLEEYLAWTRRAADRTRLVNPAEVLAWNTDKGYLVGLAGTGVPVVPTRLVEGQVDIDGAVADWGTAVVKPRVSAAGHGVTVVDAGSDPWAPGGATWLVQPLVASIRDAGEPSLFVLGSTFAQARKVPGPGEIRVQPRFGGRTVDVPVEAEAREVAVAAMDAATALAGARPAYGRVDLMRLDDGVLAVSEVELVEPGLYLDVQPGNAAGYADAVLGL